MSRALAALVSAALLIVAVACNGSPTATPTPTGGATPTPTTGVTATPTTQPTPTGDVTPTPTAGTPAPTASPSPTPTVTPLPSNLELSITSPTDGSTVQTAVVPVQGVTEPGAAVTVNGAMVEVGEDGTFSTAVRLNAGVNTIEVRAAGVDGAVVTRTIAVTYQFVP